YRRLALARADHRAAVPGCAVTVERRRVLDVQLDSRAGELALHRRHCRETPPVGKTIQFAVCRWHPSGLVETIDGVGQVHSLGSFWMCRGSGATMVAAGNIMSRIFSARSTAVFTVAGRNMPGDSIIGGNLRVFANNGRRGPGENDQFDRLRWR